MAGSALAPLLLASVLGGVCFLAPDGTRLPFETHTEVESFLRDAEVLSREELPGSLNRPEKLLLQAGDVRAHAVFRTVDRQKKSARIGKTTIRDFHDSYRFECAAYELSKLLGMDSVPPCVLRKIEGVEGSLQLFIEESVTERRDRDSKGSPLAERNPEAVERMRLFDALIDNFDRHSANVLVDSRDRVWLVDHTRSFRLYTSAQGLERVLDPDPAFLRRLADLDRGTLARHLSPFFGGRHVDALMRRRGQILRHFGVDVEESRGDLAKGEHRQ